jgi:hypothetical protein
MKKRLKKDPKPLFKPDKKILNTLLMEKNIRKITVQKY